MIPVLEDERIEPAVDMAMGICGAYHGNLDIRIPLERFLRGWGMGLIALGEDRYKAAQQASPAAFDQLDRDEANKQIAEMQETLREMAVLLRGAAGRDSIQRAILVSAVEAYLKGKGL